MQNRGRNIPGRDPERNLKIILGFELNLSTCVRGGRETRPLAYIDRVIHSVPCWTGIEIGMDFLTPGRSKEGDFYGWKASKKMEQFLYHSPQARQRTSKSGEYGTGRVTPFGFGPRCYRKRCEWNAIWVVRPRHNKETKGNGGKKKPPYSWRARYISERTEEAEEKVEM